MNSQHASCERNHKHIQAITLDVDFLYTLLNDCIDLNTLMTNLMRQNNYYHQNLHHSMSTPHNIGSELPSHRIIPKECIVEKFLELLLHVRIESFVSAYKIFKLICHFQKCYNLKYRSKTHLVSDKITY